MNLTPSQQDALALDKNIAVTAGAGSGKTRILVERFIKIALRNPELTTRVAAITFTEKAAGEMRERIAETLRKLLSEADDPEEIRKLRLIRDRLGSAHISTIHGFCSRLLREFPIEAGIQPDFNTLDDIQQKFLQYKAIDATIKDLDDNVFADSAPGLRLLYARIGMGNLRKMLLTALRAPFDMHFIYQRFMRMTEDEYLTDLVTLWIKNFELLDDPIQREAFLGLVRDILAELHRPPVNERARKLVRAMRDLVEAGPFERDNLDWYKAFIMVLDAFTTSKDQPFANARSLGGKKEWSEENMQRIEQASNLAAELLNRLMLLLPKFVPGDYDREWFRIFKVFLELYHHTRIYYQFYKNTEGALDFEDLQLRLYLLLNNNESVRQKLARRFRYIMVDEFQDTNRVQWKLIEHLARDENGRLRDDALFVVGDPKQSIYGFRDADIRIFSHVKELLAKHAGYPEISLYDGHVVFRESFRFVPAVNAFINHVFENLLKSDAIDPFGVGYEALQAMRTPENTDTHIELMVLDESDEEKDEALYIAHRIRRLMREGVTVHEYDAALQKEIPRRAHYGDIAVLLRDRGKLNDVEQALRRYNIPFKTVGGIGFWQQSEVYELYHLLRFLSNPFDDLALVALLRSRFFMFSDVLIHLLGTEEEATWLNRLQGALKAEYSDEERQRITETAALLQKWLDLRERIPLNALLLEVIEDVGLKAQLLAEFNGAQRVANLDKLCALAEHFELHNPGGLKAFYALINDLVTDEARESQALTELDDSGSVKIMTIHASKGLQFPIVFIPGLGVKPRFSSQIPHDAELGISIDLKPIYPDEGKPGHLLHILLSKREKWKQRAEYLRIFYVAFSRASDHLFLSASVKDNKLNDTTMLYRLLKSLFRERDDDTLLIPETVNRETFSIRIDTDFTVEEASPDETPVGFFQRLDIWEEYLRRYQPAAVIPEPPEQRASRGRMFSATALKTFLEKPHVFEERYMLGFFRDDYIAFENHRVEESVSDALLRGAIIHRYLELYALEPDKEALVERILFEFEVFDPAHQREIRALIHTLEQRLNASETAQGILNAAEYKNEVSARMRLGDDYLTGTFDRMQKDARGQWEIIDYKTNRINAEQLQAAGAHYHVQMEVYALLLSALFPGQSAYRVSLYFLEPDRLYSRSYTPGQLEEQRRFYAATIRDIKARFPLVD